MDAILGNQIGISFLVVWLLERLKTWTKISWVTQETGKLNRIIAVIVAFLTSVGFSFTLTGTLWTGGHIGIDFPSLEIMLRSLVKFLIMFATQAGFQEGFYQAAVKTRTLPAGQPVLNSEK